MTALSRRAALTGWTVAGLILSTLLGVATARGAIPATPLMTVYQFDGPLAVPYFDVDRFLGAGPSAPAGTLAQGTSVIPCLVVRHGKPLTDRHGTPYVGMEIIVDARTATPGSTARFKEIAAQRRTLMVANHHCSEGTRFVIDVRRLAALDKPPSFDPPRPAAGAPVAGPAGGELDEIVRAFHASLHCESVNRRLIGRREALASAWDAFVDEHGNRWPARRLVRARHLDYVMRTALYEGHLGRGCSAYGACERNVIALSIRNRGIERCLRGQGCAAAGDFTGVASTVSQYNIWDEFLTQTSGLTSCFLRPDLAGHEHYARLQAMYAHSAGDVEGILYGDAGDLQTVFPGTPVAELTRLRHYYHPPAMGTCFAARERLEYISGAVARRGDDFALIASTRIRVGERRGDGYLFQQAVIDAQPDRDVVTSLDRYPGFVIDGRKVELAQPSRCAPYGTPRGCRFAEIGRHRKTPSWLASGDPVRLTCRVQARGEDCRAGPTLEATQVGGVCDTTMQPVAGVP